ARGARSNDIGGLASGAGNVISGNAAAGVAFALSGANNTVLGNTIRLTADRTTAPGNFDGVRVAEGALGAIIGSAEVGAGNLIATNLRHGVVLWDSGTRNNTVRGNYIVANADSGVVIGNGASDNAIGGSLLGQGNTIAYNGTNGVGTVAGGR